MWSLLVIFKTRVKLLCTVEWDRWWLSEHVSRKMDTCVQGLLQLLKFIFLTCQKYPICCCRACYRRTLVIFPEARPWYMSSETQKSKKKVAILLLVLGKLRGEEYWSTEILKFKYPAYMFYSISNSSLMQNIWTAVPDSQMAANYKSV